MAGGDFQINSRVRGIFAKHWLDTSQLSVVTIKGNVYIGGHIRKLPAVSLDVEVNEDLMENINYELTRIKGLKRVTYRLEEWRREGGKFISMGHRKKASEDQKKRADDMAKRAGYGKEDDYGTT